MLRCSGYRCSTTSFKNSGFAKVQILLAARWGSLTIILAGNKAKRLSSVNHTTKSIHHHHLLTLFDEDFPIVPTPTLFLILPNTYLQPPPPLLLFLWFIGWSSHIWCVIVLNNIMDLHRLSVGTLLPEEPCCVLCN